MKLVKYLAELFWLAIQMIGIYIFGALYLTVVVGFVLTAAVGITVGLCYLLTPLGFFIFLGAGAGLIKGLMVLEFPARLGG